MLTSIKDAVFYHIYPLGFCGAINNGKDISSTSGFNKFDDRWIKHLKNMGINAIYFGPIFKSSYHGYDTIDYLKIDDRLGTNDDFKNIVTKLHDNNIRVIIDGVFNHVGREFWAFEDVKNNKSNSQYASWFNIDFNGNSNYNDGFYYEGWEGHYDLVKLNLYNKNVKDYLLHVVEYWIDKLDIDGIRLDVAYSLDKNFIKELRFATNKLKRDFWLMGEMIHGDYNSIVSPEMLHSATNYELYKGLYSSHNDKNYFEIAYSLNRQFGEYGIYKNLTLYNFVDNHDVNRIATIINDKRYLNNIYTLLFTIPGIPSIYYGSEWGIEGDRSVTDLTLRPALSIDDFDNNESSKNLETFITRLINIRKNNKELTLGIYKEFIVKNRQFVFGRYLNNNWIIILLNLDDKEAYIELNSPFKNSTIINLLDENDKYVNENNKITIKMNAFSSKILKEI